MADDVVESFASPGSESKARIKHTLLVGEACIFLIVVFLVLLAVDFRTVKNITGRLLVGLRWWNKVDEDGTSTWIFESKKKLKTSQPEIVAFWGGLFFSLLLWILFFPISFLRFSWEWGIIPVIGLVLNTWRYMKRRSDKRAQLWSVHWKTNPETDPKSTVYCCGNNHQSKEVPNDDTNKQLLEYVLKVFDSDEATIRKYWRKASTQEKPEIRLVCLVKSGRGLVSKDANGKSDPYVRIGIIDATQQGESVVRQKNLTDWVKEGGIMPTGEIVKTEPQKATLEPHWNEKLVLSMGHAEREMLVVEVWDDDHELTASTRVKGLKHLVRDFRKTDDYMGRAFFSLWSLDHAMEKELELFSHSGKSKYGYLTLGLSIEQVKVNISLQVGMWKHMQLTHSIVNHEDRVSRQYRRGELSEEAEKLLDKHAEFSGLSEAHKAAIRLSVLIKYHRMCAVKMSTFLTLIRKITALEAEIEHSTTEAGTSQTEWVNILFKDLGELAVDIEEVLNDHLTVFNIKDPKDVQRLRHHVEILCELYAFRPFVKGLPEAKKDLPQLLEKSVQIAVPNCFIVLCGQLMPDQNTPDMQLSAFKALIEHILNHCRRILDHVHPIFHEVGADYFTEFYLAIDKLILVEALSKLEIKESPDDVITYEVYKVIKEIRKLRKSIPKGRHRELKINDFHRCFRGKVNKWINMATDRCKEKIKKAISLDKFVQVTDKVKFSSSAVDGTGFLFMLMRLSDELEWPAKAEAFTLKVSIVKSVCECALFYVEEVFSRLSKEDMFDEQGRFRATERLGIVLNNMQHIKQALLEHLKERSQQESRKKLTEERAIQKHSNEVMGTLIESIGEDIETKIAEIISEIIKQIKPEIIRLIEEILDRKSHTISLEVIDPLMSYLASNLKTLGNHLLTPVFQKILTDMWYVSIDCMPAKSGDASKKLSDPSQYYHKLKFILESVRELFHAGGDGLDQEQLNIDNYKLLVDQLDILSLPTDKLILKFFAELGKIQTALANSENDQYGRILLSVGYHQDKEIIELDVIQAKGLSALDSSGTSDPFVEVCLMPPWHFGHSHPKKQKTAIKKKTLNPTFNEEFIIPASKESLQTKGAVLLLTIFDHDLIRSNDLCGICVISCQEIPILTPVRSAFDNPNAVERKNLRLPLFRISDNTIALNELSARGNSSDQKASNFLKINKQILDDLDSSKLRRVTSTSQKLIKIASEPLRRHRKSII